MALCTKYIIAGYQVPEPASIAAVGSVLAALLLILWRAALPKPIAGIPHNKLSATRIRGDSLEWSKDKRGLRFWMRDQFRIHNSPIVQIFVAPFKKPWVIVADFREAQDLVMRRPKDIEKSDLSNEVFRGVAPASHVCMKSNDLRFRHNKELLRDLMTTGFLHEVSAREIYEKMSPFLELWTLKTRRANGRPFRADEDIHLVAMDFIMSVAFDFPLSETMATKHLNHLRQLKQPKTQTGVQVGSIDSPFEFPQALLDAEVEACLYLTRSLGVGFQSSLPALAHWRYLQSKESQKMIRIRDKMISRNIDKAVERLLGQETDKRFKCVVDQMLLRESTSAQKRGVQPAFHKQAIYDELFVYILGGHDTTSITLTWWVKYIALFQDAQLRLRNDLYTFHPAAFAEKRLPTANEIVDARIPYLEAFIEETMRHSHIVPAVLRQTVVDTPILGYQVPKGTHLWLFSSAASFMQPAFDIDEEKRSESARQAKGRVGDWDPETIGIFAPERWLRMDKSSENGEVVEREVFDANAGPHLAFGAGPRACFGRKLAYMEMRIVVTLFMWTFEFIQTSGGLNDMTAVDYFMVRPETCYVRVREIEY